MNKPVAGVDLGGTNINAGIATSELSGQGVRGIIGRGRKKTKAELGPDGVIERVAEAVENACDEAHIDPEELGAIGIGAPGAIEPGSGMVLEAVNLRWNRVRLGEMLSERFGGAPVVVDNDVNVAILAEHRLGAGEHAQHLLGVWIGTGVGGGIILNGKLHYGAFGSAGEIGHMHASPYNQPGERSLEHNCSRTALADRLTKLIKANHASIIPQIVNGDLSRIRSKVIAQAYARGDALTREVVDHAADLLGIIIGGAVTLLSLERVVLGGGFTEALGEPFVDLVRAGARRVIFPNAAKNVEIVASELSEDAGIAGAALLALESIRQPEPTA